MSQVWIELEICYDSDARLPGGEGERITLLETGIRSLTPYSDEIMGNGTIIVTDTLSKSRASRVIRVKEDFEEIRAQLSDPTHWLEVNTVSDSVASVTGRGALTLIRLVGVKAIREVTDTFGSAQCQITLDGAVTEGVARSLVVTQSYDKLKSALTT